MEMLYIKILLFLYNFSYRLWAAGDREVTSPPDDSDMLFHLQIESLSPSYKYTFVFCTSLSVIVVFPVLDFILFDNHYVWAYVMAS